MSELEEKCIRVVRPQESMALQQFVREIVDAVNEGYIVDPSDSNRLHAVRMRPGDYMVTLVKGAGVASLEEDKVANDIAQEKRDEVAAKKVFDAEKKAEDEEAARIKAEKAKPKVYPLVDKWIEDGHKGEKDFFEMDTKKLKSTFEDFGIEQPRGVKSKKEIQKFLTKVFNQE